MVDRLHDWQTRYLQAIFQLGKVFAQRIVAWAQKNARWTDRTSNARQGLTARCLKTANGFVIWLFHTMEYGKWLELSHSGKYAIILEALENFYAPLMSAIEKLLKG